jgi:hypothetical protein
MERFEDLKAKLTEIEEEAEKFYTKGNKLRKKLKSFTQKVTKLLEQD